MKRILLFPVLTLLSTLIHAKDNSVDLRDVNLQGKVVEVSAPNILKVEVSQAGERRILWIDLIEVDFGAQKDMDCDNGVVPVDPKRTNRLTRNNIKLDLNIANACDRLDDWLGGELVHLEITEWSQPILKGYVFDGNTNVNRELISRGWYPVDYLQTRDASLALLEKTARCNRVGIWQSKMGVPEEDMKCQD